MNVNPVISYTGGSRGWIGDSPFIYLDTQKIRHLGWEPKYDIESGVKKTIDWLLKNEWCLSRD